MNCDEFSFADGPPPAGSSDEGSSDEDESSEYEDTESFGPPPGLPPPPGPPPPPGVSASQNSLDKQALNGRPPSINFSNCKFASSASMDSNTTGTGTFSDFCRALYDYDATGSDEISFEEGESGALSYRDLLHIYQVGARFETLS